ncbi:MAG TPA: sensor histidine kinase, partial [Acidimicrobiales bacterium]|nr:sensor histidine kinase [Acidimicrobiales bacterium]
NVRAHTPPGTTGRVTVRREDDSAVIEVADNGPGMEPEEAEHVFERFYRSDPSRSRAHGGAGLGLSIVSAIVAAHAGTVSATGAAGSGTTFIVHLPITPPAVEASPDTGERVLEGDGLTGGATANGTTVNGATQSVNVAAPAGEQGTR